MWGEAGEAMKEIKKIYIFSYRGRASRHNRGNRGILARLALPRSASVDRLAHKSLNSRAASTASVASRPGLARLDAEVGTHALTKRG
jgi:hypothetical protein